MSDSEDSDYNDNGNEATNDNDDNNEDPEEEKEETPAEDDEGKIVTWKDLVNTNCKTCFLLLIYFMLSLVIGIN